MSIINSRGLFIITHITLGSIFSIQYQYQISNLVDFELLGASLVSHPLEIYQGHRYSTIPNGMGNPMGATVNIMDSRAILRESIGLYIGTTYGPYSWAGDMRFVL